MAELETDVQHLQGQLERQQVQLREADRDKTRAVSELSEQNHRLLEQLSRVSVGPGLWGWGVTSILSGSPASSQLHQLINIKVPKWSFRVLNHDSG